MKQHEARSAHLWRPALAGLLILGWTSPSLTTEQRFSERLAVTEVEVSVQVLHKGDPVRGLTADDFVVEVDGEERPITGFEVVDLSFATDGPAAAVDEAGPEAPGTETVPPRSRHLLLLFDFAYSQISYLERALEGARAMVAEQLHPLDKVAVAIYSPTTGIEILDGFIADRSETQLALDFVAARVNGDTQAMVAALSALERRRFDDPATAASSPEQARLATLSKRLGAAAALALEGGPAPFAFGTGGGGGGLGLVNSAPAERIAGEPLALNFVPQSAAATTPLALEPELSAVRNLGLNLADLATLLRSLPDPKHLVFLSQGLPASYLRDRRIAGRATERLEPMIEAFLASGWVLQAIDISGIPGPFSRGFNADSLLYLARSTGGQVQENFNRIAVATERIVERTSVTYLLAVAIDRPEPDGRFHPIDVELRDPLPGAKLLHRPGFHAGKPPQRQTRLERGLDLAELILSDEEVVDFPLELEAYAVPTDGGRTEIPFVLEVDGDVLLSEGGERAAGSGRIELEVHAYAVDRGGGIQDLLRQRLSLDRRRFGSRLARGGLRYVGGLETAAGPQEIRVLLHDALGGRNSLHRLELEVPDIRQAEIALLPPIFLDASEDWVSLRSRERAFAPPTSQLLAERLEPLVRPTVDPRQPASFLMEIYSAPEVSPRLSARVLDAARAEVPGATIELSHRLDPATARSTGIIATLDAGALAPGQYQLEVTVEDAVSGSRSRSSSSFSVRSSS